jgi:hypothetical protein
MSDSDSDIDAIALESASKRARKSHQSRALVAAVIDRLALTVWRYRTV